MDPIAVSALTTLLTSLVGGAAGEAGKSAWESLAGLVRRRFGHDSPAVQAIEAGRDPGEIGTLLAEAAEADSGFAEALAAWRDEAARVVVKDQRVTNSITGTVHGNAVQVSGDVHGSITFG